jgi:hypothetical protein
MTMCDRCEYMKDCCESPPAGFNFILVNDTAMHLCDDCMIEFYSQMIAFLGKPADIWGSHETEDDSAANPV